MAIDGLMIIGESINDSVPSTKKLFDSGDIDGLLALARGQDEAGAAYIDVNIGSRPAVFMMELVRAIQTATRKPLSIDSPDPVLAKAGLEAYDLDRAEGKLPILNSISPLRMEMFDLYSVCPFRPILLASEQIVAGRSAPCRTAEETYLTAKSLVAQAKERANIDVIDCILDPGIAPVGSDMEGNLTRLFDALSLIRNDPCFSGVHASVGLSNFTVMLPSKRADGSPVKGPLENAFLTKAMPLGIDMVIGSVKRNYRLLGPEDPAICCVDDCLRLGGIEAVMRVREFYTE